MSETDESQREKRVEDPRSISLISAVFIGKKNDAPGFSFRLQAFPPKLRRALPVEAGWVAVGESHVPAGARWAGLAESHSTLLVLASDELGRAFIAGSAPAAPSPEAEAPEPKM